MPSNSIVIADDHALLRDMLRQYLDSQHGFRVVADVADAASALAVCETLHPSVLLVDVDMPGMSVFDAMGKIRRVSPQTEMIILTAYLNDHYIDQALAMQVAGYVIKDQSLETLVEAIRAVLAGGHYFSPQVQSRIALDQNGIRLSSHRRSRLQLLTQRELQILGYLAQGLQKKEIANILNISAKTVDQHTTHIMTKLDIHDRVDLTRYAIREGVVNP